MARWVKGEGWIDRDCAHCGSPFRVPRHRVKTTPSVYCSVSCANKSRAGRHVDTFADKNEIARLYVDEHMTLQQIGDQFGVTPQAVAYHLKRMGVDRREWDGTNVLLNPVNQSRARASHTSGAAHHEYRDIPGDEIEALYLEGKSTTEIAVRYDVTAMTIQRRLKKMGIPLRQSGFSRWQIADDGHQVQSGWERAVDDWLFEHNIEHTCQPALPFGRGLRGDFLAKGWYIEVWGVTHNATYAQRRDAKIAQYRENGLNLIEVYPRHIEREGFKPLHILL